MPQIIDVYENMKNQILNELIDISGTTCTAMADLDLDDLADALIEHGFTIETKG